MTPEIPSRCPLGVPSGPRRQPLLSAWGLDVMRPARSELETCHSRRARQSRGLPEHRAKGESETEQTQTSSTNDHDTVCLYRASNN